MKDAWPVSSPKHSLKRITMTLSRASPSKGVADVGETSNLAWIGHDQTMQLEGRRRLRSLSLTGSDGIFKNNRTDRRISPRLIVPRMAWHPSQDLSLPSVMSVMPPRVAAIARNDLTRNADVT